MQEALVGEHLVGGPHVGEGLVGDPLEEEPLVKGELETHGAKVKICYSLVVGLTPPLIL